MGEEFLEGLRWAVSEGEEQCIRWRTMVSVHVVIGERCVPALCSVCLL